MGVILAYKIYKFFYRALLTNALKINTKYSEAAENRLTTDMIKAE